MAEINSIARPYAKSIFDLACKAGQCEYWGMVLARLEYVVGDVQAKCLLNNPTLPIDAKVEFIDSITKAINIIQHKTVAKDVKGYDGQSEEYSNCDSNSSCNSNSDSDSKYGCNIGSACNSNDKVVVEDVLMQQAIIKLLAASNRLLLIPAINKIYTQYLAEQEHKLEVQIFSARNLAQAEVAQIQQQLSQKYKKNVVLQVNYEPELIGGIKMKIGDDMIDGSIKGQLSALRSVIVGGT